MAWPLTTGWVKAGHLMTNQSTARMRAQHGKVLEEMCNFLSAIYTRNKRLIASPEYTDSHSDLLRFHGIKERDTSAPVQQFVRLELIPSSSADVADVSTWKEVLDEHEVPEWFDKAARHSAFYDLREVADSMVVTNVRDFLLGGCHVIAGDADVGCVQGGRIVSVRDNAQVHCVRGNAQVHDVRDNGQVHCVRGNAQVHCVRDNAQVHCVRGNAQVHDVRDNAQVHRVRDNAQVHCVRDNGQVHRVWDNAQVHRVWDNGQVHCVRGNAQVHDVRDNGQVHRDHRKQPEEPTQ